MGCREESAPCLSPIAYRLSPIASRPSPIACAKPSYLDGFAKTGLEFLVDHEQAAVLYF
jgi:hypothetical protein